jgi:hypothetical protein
VHSPHAHEFNIRLAWATHLPALGDVIDARRYAAQRCNQRGCARRIDLHVVGGAHPLIFLSDFFFVFVIYFLLFRIYSAACVTCLGYFWRFHSLMTEAKVGHGFATKGEKYEGLVKRNEFNCSLNVGCLYHLVCHI